MICVIQHSSSFFSQACIDVWTDLNNGPICCLAHHSEWNLLAVGYGGAILLACYSLRGRDSTPRAAWTNKQFLPPPPNHSVFPEEELVPRSLQFLRGQDLLVASYLNHGVELVVSGFFALKSPITTFPADAGIHVR
jgi:hypothetical protein